jgi:hypothetical protein
LLAKAASGQLARAIFNGEIRASSCAGTHA